MNILKIVSLMLSVLLLGMLAACGQSEESTMKETGAEASNEETHEHEDGTTHADHDDGMAAESEDHAHDDEVSLGTVTIGGMEVELAQGHGAVAAGQEGHLVVKLPYTDNGATTVRAWIGTEDRTLSYVGKGEYAPSHDDYDIHAMAPDPLPEGAMWWIEIEKPDGTKVVGSVEPMMN